MKVLLPVLVALAIASCGGVSNACLREPAGRTNAFFAGEQPARDAVMTVAAISPLERGGFRYDMADGSQLTWLADEPISWVNAGRSYRFVVDYAPGSPDASGILVYDRDDLSFAAVTDARPFLRVAKNGIPGFSVALGDASCTSRPRTKCHTALVNLPVAFSRESERVVLHHGESARLGPFEVRVLTAQKVSYAPRCADAGLPGVSFTIRRVE